VEQRKKVCPLVDPGFQQARHAGHRETSESGDDVSHGATARDVGDQAAGNGKRGADRSDDVADPVDKVKKRALMLRARLALDCDVGLWCRPQVLGEQDHVGGGQEEENCREQERRPLPRSR
jgi:hypothetical protein